MKRLFLFSAALSASTALASAADIYTPPPYVPPVVHQPAAFNWTGVYGGIHGGFGGNRFEYPAFLGGGELLGGVLEDTGLGEILGSLLGEGELEDLLGDFDGISGQGDITSSGFFAGGQIGANWQFAPQWVLGVEADAAWSDIKGEVGVSLLDGFADLTLGSKVNWFGTIRGRLGFLPTPRLMIYGTGGAAVGETETYLSGSFGPLGGSTSTSGTEWGWTAGGGLEYAVSNNVTLKTEYLYVDLGSQQLLGLGDLAGIDVKTKFHTIKAGLNFLYGNNGGSGADFAYTEAPADDFNWTGVYAGVHGGYGGDRFDYPFSTGDEGLLDGIGDVVFFLADLLGLEEGDLPVDPLTVTAEGNVTSSGFFGGGQVGANWQFADSWVLGVQADASVSGIKGEVGVSVGPCCLGFSGADIELGSKVNWFGTLRGRLGFLPTQRLLVYGTGGAAYGETESYVEGNIDGVSGSISLTDTNWGWTAGGGFEYAITDTLTFNTEYLYVDLGSTPLIDAAPLADLDVETHFHSVRAGFNVLFN